HCAAARRRRAAAQEGQAAQRVSVLRGGRAGRRQDIADPRVRQKAVCQRVPGDRAHHRVGELGGRQGRGKVPGAAGVWAVRHQRAAEPAPAGLLRPAGDGVRLERPAVVCVSGGSAAQLLAGRPAGDLRGHQERPGLRGAAQRRAAGRVLPRADAQRAAVRVGQAGPAGKRVPAHGRDHAQSAVGDAGAAAGAAEPVVGGAHPGRVGAGGRRRAVDDCGGAGAPLVVDARVQRQGGHAAPTQRAL
ncbi:hypothetical protein IWW51_005715, partial [Coemansia sp. RSA 2702]